MTEPTAAEPTPTEPTTTEQPVSEPARTEQPAAEQPATSETEDGAQDGRAPLLPRRTPGANEMPGKPIEQTDDRRRLVHQGIRLRQGLTGRRSSGPP